jgi:tripartite-type tricarboxylate transporter receptor subunit TctC
LFHGFGENTMKLPRRQFLHLAAGAAALPTLPRFAWAQAYPTRPVRIIVGFAPGGGADIIARLTTPRSMTSFGPDPISGAWRR